MSTENTVDAAPVVAAKTKVQTRIEQWQQQLEQVRQRILQIQQEMAQLQQQATMLDGAVQAYQCFIEDTTPTE